MTFCQECGRQQASAAERFCGACGRAYPEVAAETAAEAAPVEAAPPAFTPPPAYAAPAATAMFAVEPPAAPKSSRKTWTLVAAAVTVLALIAGGVLVGFKLFGDKGGAGTAQDAATQLVSALTSQDIVGVANMLDPAEVGGLTNAMSKAQDELKKKGAGGSNGQIVDGVTVKTPGLSFSSTSLTNSGDVSRVEVTGGRYEVTVNFTKLVDSVAKLAPDEGDLVDGLKHEFEGKPDKHINGDIVDLMDEGQLVSHDLIAVKKDGRWYISVYATAANWAYEAAKSNGDVPSGVRGPDWNLYSNPPAPKTATDAAGVIQNLVSAVNDNSPSELLANLPTDQVRGLLPFGPMLDDLAKKDPVKGRITASDLKVTTQERDGKVAATFTAGTFSTTDGDPETVTLEGRCMTKIYSDGYDDENCIPAKIADAVGFDGVTLMLRKVDGGLQLDPIASITNGVNSLMNHKDDIKNLMQDLMEGFASGASL